MQKFTSTPEELGSEYAEGSVTKAVLFRAKGLEVAELTFAPGSKTRLNNHVEREKFYHPATGETRVYEPGEDHYIENTTARPQVWISIKGTLPEA